MYRLSREHVLAFLYETFGTGEFHVRTSCDMFIISLPRPLSIEEKQTLDLKRSEIRSFALDSETETLHTETAEFRLRENNTSIPMIRGPIQNDVVLPQEDKVRDLTLTYSVSNTNAGREGVSSSLYGISISKGCTSTVFAVDARWSWARKDASQPDEGRGFKVAVKRLSEHTEPGQFRQEYDALKKATKDRHRNIVELLNAFRYEEGMEAVYYNFSFPLAIGNLKELFNDCVPHKPSGEGVLNTNLTAYPLSDDLFFVAVNSLWSEFAGLGSALAHLHENCQITHSDIKPSNVLLYGPSGSPPTLTAKLTDFGLAVDLKTRLTWQLGSKEAQSAWEYEAPEIRTAFEKSQMHIPAIKPTELTHDLSAKHLMSGDVWKLGSVFLEMLTFLVEGRYSVKRFREFITTTVGELTSDDLSDSRFDDGEKVKVEVLQWLSRLATKDLRAQQIQDLLRSMLDKGSKRPSSGHVAQVLRSFSFCAYFDGVRRLNFTPSSLLSPPSLVDRCKQTVETKIGYPVSWWPFKDGNRWCPQGYSRISWYWSTKKLYIDVPDVEAQAYKSRCQAISDITEPASRPSQPSSPGSRLPMDLGHQVPSSFVINVNSSENNNSLSSLPSGSQSQNSLSNSSNNGLENQDIPSVQASSKEIYWCVDKAWSEPQSTKLCSLQEHPAIRDDEALYERLIKEYNRIRTWKGRLLSWKSCLGIEFIEFARTSTGHDHIIRIQIGLPPSSASSYELSRITPEGVHMKIAASELIAGMYQPKRGRGKRTTLIMIPKRIRVVSANGTSSEDWGMHGLQGFSLWKILAWIAFLTVVGLTIMIFWLTFVDKTDLVNAFVPFTFLGTMVMISLGVPQLLGAD